MKKTNPAAQLNLLASQIGDFIEYWGFKKIHGCIWTHLYLSPTPLSAQDLIARLKVSKALISLSMKDLIHYELIRQTEDSENKKNKFYTANVDVFNAIRGVLEEREAKMITCIAEEFRILAELQHADKRSPLIDGERLQALGKMVSGANTGLQSLLRLTLVDTSFLKSIFRN